jgi:hypothetical protein
MNDKRRRRLQAASDGHGGQAEDEMKNPWTAKNPFMSAWLSSANKVAGSARGHATAAVRRELATMQAEAAKQVIAFWSGQPAAAPSPKRKRTRKKR